MSVNDDLILPVSSPKELIRLGGTEDGAYILPDDLKDIYACFSPGVSPYKSFEDELSLKYKIKSFLCDYSTDPSKLSTPLIKDFQFFDKKFLGNKNKDNYITLENWVNKYSPEKLGKSKISGIFWKYSSQCKRISTKDNTTNSSSFNHFFFLITILYNQRIS